MTTLGVRAGTAILGQNLGFASPEGSIVLGRRNCRHHAPFEGLQRELQVLV